MNIEIPEFLLEMSKQMNNQNNRMTASPLFEVRYKDYLVTEQGYNESHYEIFEDDDYSVLYHSKKNDDYTELAEYLDEHHREWCIGWCEDNDVELNKNAFIESMNECFDDELESLPDELKKLYMQEIEITVNSHFTEAGAQQFIDRKQHDYKKLYIYAISLCYVEQMTELRNWIKGIDNE